MTSYRDAGVDIVKADEHVARIASLVTATWSDEVVGSFGGFASGVEIPQGFKRPVLMMSTDGVGTKLDLARQTGQWDGVGFDLVAMCVDDLAVAGARPLGFVDYLSVGAIEPERDAQIVGSIARACSHASCSLLGGETAEHPGVMDPDRVDLAGAVVGIVEKGTELGPHQVGAGDLVIGLRSPNVRSNGFSLIRAALGEDILRYSDSLLEASVIYAPSVLQAVSAGGIHAAAHVTGGGLAANLGRSLPEGCGASVDPTTWTVPDIFSVIAAHGVERTEMFSTFNMGIGFCLIVDQAKVDDVLDSVREHAPVVIGEVTPEPGVELMFAVT